MYIYIRMYMYLYICIYTVISCLIIPRIKAIRKETFSYKEVPFRNAKKRC